MCSLLSGAVNAAEDQVKKGKPSIASAAKVCLNSRKRVCLLAGQLAGHIDDSRTPALFAGHLAGIWRTAERLHF